jgi:hypothetical protein
VVWLKLQQQVSCRVPETLNAHIALLLLAVKVIQKKDQWHLIKKELFSLSQSLIDLVTII